jgi:carbamoyl-phosphate synthase / aspartate carbamoyltransferase / dihydroorotase
VGVFSQPLSKRAFNLEGSFIMPMTKMTLPGLIDVHVHMREPGATHKEDWQTGTAAALAGGFTIVLGMPNTAPPATTAAAFRSTVEQAQSRALCDFGQYAGAGPANAQEIASVAGEAAGLKMYLDSTYGELRLDQMPLWMEHFKYWPKTTPIAVHAESRTLAAAILMAALFDRHLHICHVSRKEEILVIKKAKERGLKITCEVTPHHLFLTEIDIPRIGSGPAEVRPVLAVQEDQDALWEHFAVIDCIATDHAPHTWEEKSGEAPPPGFPGLETALPLMLTAVRQNRLTMDQLIEKMVTNPKRIFNLPEQPETWVEIELDAGYEIAAAGQFSRCGWTPFEGRKVSGKVTQVTLRGETVYKDGTPLARPGSGKNVRKTI